MARGRFGRRAALRAAMAAGIAYVATMPPRLRPARRAALITAATGGAVQELPAAGAVAGVAGAALSVWARQHPDGSAGAATEFGVADAAFGSTIGSAASLLTRRMWPVAPRTAAEIRPALTPLGGEPTEDGDGLTFVVNPSAGPALQESPADELREAFPKATVLETGDDLDMDTALERAATSAKAIGIAGGDGSVSAAAAVASGAGKPLVVIPAGTLNHLARDLGVHTTEDAIAAVKDGDLVAVDLGSIDGKTFLNTASFGAYSELVDARERLEGTIGKWPALVVALFQMLRRYEPIDVEIDGKPHRLWMIFVGNCQYHPDGFAPSWRERLDDGVLDVRMVDADVRWARVQLLAAVLTGRLGRCRAYVEFTTKKLTVKALGEQTLRLARDGETFDGSAEFEIAKADKPLAVYVRRSDRPT